MKHKTTRKKNLESTDFVSEKANHPAGRAKSAQGLNLVSVEHELDELTDYPVLMYLREIGRVSLLTAKEEQVLAEGRPHAEICRGISRRGHDRNHLKSGIFQTIPPHSTAL